MNKFWFGVVAFGAAAVSAQASVICATPQEMKVLQSAALQQQLMVAALTCHKSEDYNRFVTSFRGQLIKSDNELKTFFAGRPRGEDYNAYKTRVANAASLRSLRDERFCESAQKVFDLAMGRGEERRGLTAEPPQLIETGYEGCRPVDDNLITVQAVPKPVMKPTAKPAETRVAGLQIAKPPIVPAPKPTLNPVDQHALALVPKAAPSAPVRVAALPPLRLAPVHAAQVSVPPAKKVPQMSMAAAEPVRKVSRAPVVQPQTNQPERYAAEEPQRYADDEPQRYAENEPQRYADEQPQRYADEEPQRYADEAPQRYADNEPQSYAGERPRGYAAPPQRYATASLPQRHRGDRTAYRQDRDNDDDQSVDDNVPNAYRPGSTWVDSQRPAWHPVAYGPPPPHWAQPHRRSYLVRTPDGRWIVVIARQPRWVRE